ncbi:hypothetical protein ACH4YO_27005 [Streptomyces noursei]|uniref:hypothetical protein n=1 Tax=Streptomyces noursei TaxID=1971 RepID=UPI003405C044
MLGTDDHPPEGSRPAESWWRESLRGLSEGNPELAEELHAFADELFAFEPSATSGGPTAVHNIAPPRGTDLRGLPALLQGRPERYLIWLDDLDEHLGEGGLEPRLLAQLAALKAVVVATMREDVYDACRPQPGGRVLDVAHIVELVREWSPAERERLAREAARSGNPRLIGAVSSSGPEGAGAYLALGPLLWDEWWRASRADRHPQGRRSGPPWRQARPRGGPACPVIT